MPENKDTGNIEPATGTEIKFKCNLCGKTKPLDELVVMRRYYPQLTACKECARSSGKDIEPE